MITPGKPPPEGWPRLPEAALFGIAGDFVKLIEPHSEADPAALLVQFLTACGNVVGRGPHFMAERDKHYTNGFAVLVGETAKGRKGTSWGYVLRTFEEVDPDWVGSCIASGLSSGEGVIWAVRDGVEPVGKSAGDPGVDDKRLFIQESEFAQLLRVLGREGNTLSPVLRNAWDTGSLRILNKNSPARATGAHVSLVGHVTRPELLRYLKDTERGNGFGNRFAYVCVRRSKCLPNGGNLDEARFRAFVARLKPIIDATRSLGLMGRDDHANARWCRIYPELSEGKPGLLGAMTARAEAQVMRWAITYAMLDGSESVREPHLRAALALWQYAEDSARFIFGDALGNPLADEILGALEMAGDEGMTRSEIRDLKGRHIKKDELDNVLRLLEEQGLAHKQTRPTGGRPAGVWFATGDKDARNAR